MIAQLSIGALLIVCTVLAESAFLAMATKLLTRAGGWLLRGRQDLKFFLTLSALSLWLIMAATVVAGIWATALQFLGVFDTLEAALYFSLVALTTLGLGDVILPPEWRLLSGIIAANGLIVFGLTTAFLTEGLGRIRKAQDKSRHLNGGPISEPN